LLSPQPDERDSAEVADHPSLSEGHVAAIASSQRPLYAYVCSLIGPGAEADDVLQEVNLVLCRRAHEFDGRGQFLTWACRIAYLQVLAHLKQRRRDRCLYFDEAVLADLAGPLGGQVERLDVRLEALRNCLTRLPAQHRQMITVRYAHGGSVQKLATQLGRPVGSVRVTLHRIRQQLLACIENTLSARGSR